MAPIESKKKLGNWTIVWSYHRKLPSMMYSTFHSKVETWETTGIIASTPNAYKEVSVALMARNGARDQIKERARY